MAELAPKAIGKRQALEFEGSEPCLRPGNATVLVELAVEDSGPGLDSADCQRLGERFFRVIGNEECSSGESGSGLGGSIVRRIAAVQDLSIDVGRSTALGRLAVRVIYDE